MEIGIIILGAGQSSRMGMNKLLLPWGEGTVFTRVCEVVSPLSGSKVAVVGSDGELLATIATAHGITPVYNINQEKGQSHSVKIGLAALPTDSLDGVLCVAADQPLLSTEFLEKYVTCFAEGNSQTIVSASYINARGESEKGNPVLFGKAWFSHLQNLQGDEGGRSILRGEGKSHLKTIGAPEIYGRDVDTPVEYNELFEQYGKIKTE